MVLLTLFAVPGYSQNKQAPRPFLFADLPASITCTEAQLSSLFAVAKGRQINVPLANNFSLSGPVISNKAQYNNLQTINIRLAAYKNTLFSLSKQTDGLNNITYVGRILNPLYADGFELQRTTQGIYQLNKIDIQKILVNCNQ